MKHAKRNGLNAGCRKAMVIGALFVWFVFLGLTFIAAGVSA